MPTKRLRGRELARARHAPVGAAAVEFALVSGVFFLLLFGIIAGCVMATDKTRKQQQV